MYAVLPSHYPALALASLQVGWLLSVNRFVRIPLNIPSGWLADRLGGKRPYIAGLGLGAISTTGYALANDFWVMLGFRLLWGIAWVLLMVAALRIVLDVSEPHSRGRLLGIYSAGAFFAGALGAMCGGFLADSIGFRQTMLILGAVTWAGFAGALTLPAKMRPAVEVETKTVEVSRVASSTGSQALLWWEMERRLLGIALLNFGHRFLFAGVFYGTLGLYLGVIVGDQISVFGFKIGVATLTATLMLGQNVITMVTAPAAGHLSDRLGDRRRMILLGEVLGVSGLTCFALGGSLGWAMVGATLIALVYGIVPPLVMAWMGDVGREGRHGATAGIFQTMGDLGSGLGPLTSYLLASVAGIFWVYGLCAALLAFTIPILLALSRTPSSEQARRFRT